MPVTAIDRFVQRGYLWLGKDLVRMTGDDDEGFSYLCCFLYGLPAFLLPAGRNNEAAQNTVAGQPGLAGPLLNILLSTRRCGSPGQPTETT